MKELNTYEVKDVNGGAIVVPVGYAILYVASVSLGYQIFK